MKNKLSKIFLFSLVLLPVLSHAQYLTKSDGILTSFQNIVSTRLIPLAFIIAVGYFFYGVAKYILSLGADKEKSKNIMTWGVVALAVMSCVWGLVAWLRTEFNVGTETDMRIPTINGGSGTSGGARTSGSVRTAP